MEAEAASVKRARWRAGRGSRACAVLGSTACESREAGPWNGAEARTAGAILRMRPHRQRRVFPTCASSAWNVSPQVQ